MENDKENINDSKISTIPRIYTKTLGQQCVIVIKHLSPNGQIAEKNYSKSIIFVGDKFKKRTQDRKCIFFPLMFEYKYVYLLSLFLNLNKILL